MPLPMNGLSLVVGSWLCNIWSLAHHESPMMYTKCFRAGASLRLEVPGSINRYLREYQREGIRFLFRQYALQQGAILADDMGLGKVRCNLIGLLHFTYERN